MKRHDFTTGNILKQMIWFTAPLMLTNLLQTSYQVIDSLWVGNLIGANALAAVAVSGTVIFTVLSLILGINSATLTVLSQQKGMGNEAGLKRYLNAFVVLLSVLAALLGIIGYVLAEPILHLLDTPDAILQDAKSYLQITFMGILFLFGYNFIGNVLRALGDSRTPLRFVVVAVVLNTILDPLFILGWGIKGAALATVVSQGCAFLYGIFHIMRRKSVPFTVPTIPKFADMRLILGLGIPSGLQMVTISAGVMAIMSVVNSFGENIVAGFGAAQRLDSLLMIPAMALGQAVNSMAGQNIGANQWDRVKHIVRYGMTINWAIMLAIACLLFPFAKYGIRMFIAEQEALEFGTLYLRTIAFLYPFLGINFVLNGAVRASGAMVQVLMLNLISFWVLRYPLTMLFSNMLGEFGIAVGIGTSFVISGILSFLYYRFGKWRERDLFGAEA